MKILAVVITLILMYPHSANAFKFDVWESGMNEDEILMTAKKNDIKLTETGEIYSYSTKLLNKNANVDLKLTNGDKRLMEISVKWMLSKELVPILKRIVEDKNPISKNYHPEYRLIMCERYEYLLDKNTSIDIEVKFVSNLEMTYRDLNLSETNAKRKRWEKKEAERNTVNEERGRFFGEEQESNEATSQIYKWTDSKGIVHYTNTPGMENDSKNAERVESKKIEKLAGYIIYLKNGKRIICDWVKMTGKTVQFMEGPIQTELSKDEVQVVEEQYETGDETKTHLLKVN